MFEKATFMPLAGDGCIRWMTSSGSGGAVGAQVDDGIGIEALFNPGAVVSNDAAGNNSYHASIKDEVARQISQAQGLVDAAKE